MREEFYHSRTGGEKITSSTDLAGKQPLGSSNLQEIEQSKNTLQ
jgi:hypothetical protein